MSQQTHLRLIKCLLCGLRYDETKHKACPSCLDSGRLRCTSEDPNDPDAIIYNPEEALDKPPVWLVIYGTATIVACTAIFIFTIA